MVCTIFTTLKSFRDQHIKTIQQNAIISWTLLRPRPEIILLGNEPGSINFAKEHGLVHVPKVTVNKYGTPYCLSVFQAAQIRAQNDVCVYINGDIILTSGFINGVEVCEKRFEHFLMIGQRYDLGISEQLSFNKNWENNLKLLVKENGSLHKVTGIDYFAFRKGDWMQMPPMVLGRIGWDNWIVSCANSRGHNVVNATEAVFVVHQNHFYNKTPEGDLVQQGVEAKKNRKLADTEGGRVHSGFINHAGWKINSRGEIQKCQSQ